ncbi:hypothetical protein B0A49_11221 [Cryomyces minteri]|uniref:Rhodopsin domain-containing protein n=1 Tax=Cryomyces minteri TaxID=331657 RepID=A0A4V6WKV2_9PEZI|nr:hypothetical protein B0A49_11221 [Cryomyces minteri]
MGDKSDLVVCLNIALISTSFVFLAVRFATRLKTRSVGQDDSTKYGLGKHSDQQHDSDVEPYQKLLLVAGFFYYLGNTLVKLSLLVFYLRLEDRRAFRYAVFAMLFIIGAFGFGRCVAALCQCVPLSHLWNPKQPGTCIHVVISYYVNGGIMMVTDLVIYLMPIQFLWRMEMPLKQKIGMFCLFMIGGCVCGASAVRLFLCHRLVVRGDATWNLASIYIWSSIELHGGICASCVPFFRAFQRQFFSNPSTSERFSYRAEDSDHHALESGQASKWASTIPDSDSEVRKPSCVTVEQDERSIDASFTRRPYSVLVTVIADLSEDLRENLSTHSISSATSAKR